MSDIAVRRADLAELSQIVKFMNEQFLSHEPVLSTYQPDQQQQQEQQEQHRESEKDEEGFDDDEFVRSCINNKSTFVAHSESQLVGILIAGKIGPCEHEETLALANGSGDRKFADIMKFMAYIERKADVCNRFGVLQSLHLHIISVHENYYGKGIAGKLFAACFEAARNDGNFAFSLDCTNVYSAKIAEKFGMELLSTVSYVEYHEHCGRVVFMPREPHTIVKSYGFKF